MPTHPLIPFMESPEGLGQDLLSSSSASMPGAGSSMTPHASSLAQKNDPDAVGNALPVDCMFCEQSFEHQEELGPHVLTEHPTTLFGPTVLRVEAEFRSPGGEWSRLKPQNVCSPLSLEEDVPMSCVVCGQEVADSAELESHMKGHKDCYCYCCSICGRRFKEPWFLKNHMRTHGGKVRGRATQDTDGPVTINGVVQSQSPPTVLSAYRLCMICGFFFADLTALTEHSRVHCHNKDASEEEEERSSDKRPDCAEERPACQDDFLRLFRLQPATQALRQQGASRGIALNPFNTYQAWQLATKGKITTGANVAKELSPDSVSDNEDSCSDKEELGRIWASVQGGRDERVGKDGVSGQLMKPSVAVTPPPEPDQKSSLRKDKPTHCQECGKSFRTYHQLVLHSRIHKRVRVGAESPTPSLDGKACSTGSADSTVLDRAGEYAEEGSEEGSPAQGLFSDKKDAKMNLKILAPSRTCTYCGKTFRSNYYLNIHLRTHTGEKPYKCKYCDYAAAQKTSLRYHLDRRHRDKPYMEIPNIPVSSTTSIHITKEEEEEQEVEEEEEPSTPSAREKTPSHSLTYRSLSLSIPSPMDSQLDSGDVYQQCTKASCSPRPQVETEPAGGWAQSTTVLKPEAKDAPNLSTKKDTEGLLECPLDLSLPVSVAFASDLRQQMPINACPSCPFTSLYPEVLLVHQKLVHRQRLEQSRRPAGRLSSAALKLKRHTGCPPALEGKDVSPLIVADSKHPRRTTSPPPQTQPPPARANREVSQVLSNQNSQSQSKSSSFKIPKLDRQDTRLIVPHTTYNPSKMGRGPVKAPFEAGHKQGAMLLDRDSGLVQRGSVAASAQTSVVWPSDAVRLCLSERFSRIPRENLSGTAYRDCSEPTTKRPKHYDAALERSPHLRPPEMGRISRLPQGTTAASVAGQGSKAAAAPSAGTVPRESDLRAISSLLPPYSLGGGDLGSLYRGSTSHASLHGTVNRPLLYPQYSGSLLQRAEPSQTLSQEPKAHQPSEKSSS